MQELKILEKENSQEYIEKGSMKYPPSFCLVVHNFVCECDDLEDISDYDHKIYLCRDCGKLIMV